MNKYTEEYKLSVIHAYLSGAGGLRKIGKRYGLDASTVRKWVLAYRFHGEASVKKKYSHYSASFKRSVIKHMQEHKLSYRQTAAYFDIREPSVLGTWESQYDAGEMQALSHCPRERPKLMRKSISLLPQPENDETRTREQLLEELSYLRMENAYLKKLKALMQANQRSARSKKRR